MDSVDGISLTIGGAAIGTICTCLVNLWKARHQRTEIAKDPLNIQQSAFQASMKDNAKDHENLFCRVASVEQRVAAIDAKVDAKIDAINEQLRETKYMVRQLFDRIIGGKRK